MAKPPRFCISNIDFRHLSLADWLDMVRQNGLDHVELGSFALDETPLADVERELALRRISVAVLDSGSVHELGRCQTDAEVETTQKHVVDCLALARRLGAGGLLVRLGHTAHRDTITAVRLVRDYLRPCLAAAEAHGVTMLIESRFDWRGVDPTRSAIESRPEHLLMLMEAVGSKFLRVNYDAANFHIAGGESFPLPYELLKPWIGYVHMKDCRRFSPLTHGLKANHKLKTDSHTGDFECVAVGRGVVNSMGILKALLDDGYEGFIGLEPHTAPAKNRAVFEESLRYLRAAMRTLARGAPEPVAS